MSRTITEIQNEIITVKEAIPELSELTSDSKVSIWRLITYVVAVSIWTQEKIADIFKQEVEDYVAKSRVHTKRWYRDRVLEFREGKDLNWFDGVFVYPELEQNEELEGLQIIKQAAVVEAPNELLIKVATSQGGLLQPITSDQELRVDAYMNEIKDAGNHIRIINLPPDEIKIAGVIYCDPLVINLNDGTLVSSPGINPVEIAANEYVNTENNRNFNGEFRRTHFINELEKAEGIKDPVITSLKARYGSLPYEEIDISYVPSSGYHTIVEMILEYKPYNE